MKDPKEPSDGPEFVTHDAAPLAVVEEMPGMISPAVVLDIQHSQAASEGLREWLANRRRLIEREQHLLNALAKQVLEAQSQRTEDRRIRYLGQAVHIRSQILELRGEINDITITPR